VSQENKNLYETFLEWKALGVWSEPKTKDIIYKVHNPLCGDEISLHCQIENDKLTIASMKGEACSVCLASSGILFSKRMRWKEEEFRNYKISIENFLNDNQPEESLDLKEKEFWTLMKEHPGRHRCAFLPFQALEKGFKGV